MATIAQEFIEEGERNAARRIAKELLTLHDPITVSQLTALPLEEVLALQKEIETGKSTT